MIRTADLFCGIGGFRLGVDRAANRLNIPVKCVFSSEIEKNAVKIYEKNFKETPSGDITKVRTSDIPDIDILCGGFPCQDVSIAGKREGLKGKRTGLFFDVVRILQEKQPSYVFLENVKGLLNSNRGWDFARILIELEDAGYSVEWDLLNSKDFGVPQNRERVFIVGSLRGRGRGKIFPIIRENDSICDKSRESKEGIYNIASTLTARQFSSWNGNYVIKNLQYIGAVNPENKWLENGKDLSRNYPQGNRVYSAEGIATCLSSQLGGLSGGSGLYQVHNSRIRKLTPVECERLQGFPDDWTAGISDTARYKCLGNSVTVNVIEAIAERILPSFS